MRDGSPGAWPVGSSASRLRLPSASAAHRVWAAPRAAGRWPARAGRTLSLMPKPFEPTKEEVLAAAGRTVPDVIAPDLRVLFCGINPGIYLHGGRGAPLRAAGQPLLAGAPPLRLHRAALVALRGQEAARARLRDHERRRVRNRGGRAGPGRAQARPPAPARSYLSQCLPHCGT